MTTYRRYGAGDEPFGISPKNLSALRPSATIKTILFAGAGNGETCGVIPFTSVVVKYISNIDIKNTM